MVSVVLWFFYVVSLIFCKTQHNNCTKWLESIENSFPYLCTHNSYHIRQSKQFKVNDDYKANVSQPRFAYTFPSLTDQLSNGVVGLELDINPQNDLSGTNDFPIYHWKTIDQTSSCITLRECLNEINEWYLLNKDLLISPLLIYIDIKDIDDYSYNELELINTIWFEIFNEVDLYTPVIHNNYSIDDIDYQYNDWSNVCYNYIKSKIIPLMNDAYLKSKLMDDNIILNLNMFPYCDCQDEANYCIVLRNECEDTEVNVFNATKYIYRQWTTYTQHYPQMNEYPYVYNQSVSYGEHLLGVNVDDQVINAIHDKYSEYKNDITNPLTADEWFYWQTAAYIDGLGNNNGKWDKSDFLNYLQILSPDRSDLGFVLDILFWQEGFDEWDILDPMLWAKLKCLYNSGYGLEEFVIYFNLSQTLIEICDKIDTGIQYLYTDYPYNWNDFNGFTMEEIEYYDLCDNITITTKIDESMITSDCLSASELQSLIIGIVVGIILVFLVLVALIVIMSCCCCCKAKCKICRDKYCKCCNCMCLKTADEDDSVDSDEDKHQKTLQLTTQQDDKDS